MTDVDMVAGTFEIIGFLDIEWYDERLAWNSQGNTTKVANFRQNRIFREKSTFLSNNQIKEKILIAVQILVKNSNFGQK